MQDFCRIVGACHNLVTNFAGVRYGPNKGSVASVNVESVFPSLSHSQQNGAVLSAGKRKGQAINGSLCPLGFMSIGANEAD